MRMINADELTKTIKDHHYFVKTSNIKLYRLWDVYKRNYPSHRGADNY